MGCEDRRGALFARERGRHFGLPRSIRSSLRFLLGARVLFVRRLFFWLGFVEFQLRQLFRNVGSVLSGADFIVDECDLAFFVDIDRDAARKAT